MLFKGRTFFGTHGNMKDTLMLYACKSFELYLFSTLEEIMTNNFSLQIPKRSEREVRKLQFAIIVKTP